MCGRRFKHVDLIRAGREGLVAFIVSGLGTQVLKRLVGRPRPRLSATHFWPVGPTLAAPAGGGIAAGGEGTGRGASDSLGSGRGRPQYTSAQMDAAARNIVPGCEYWNVKEKNWPRGTWSSRMRLP